MTQVKMLFLVFRMIQLRDQGIKQDTCLMIDLTKFLSWLQRLHIPFLFDFQMLSPLTCLVHVLKHATEYFLSELRQVKSILKDLWEKEARFCMLLCDFQHNLSVSEKKRGYEMFFLKSLLVPPNRFRPSTVSALGVSRS